MLDWAIILFAFFRWDLSIINSFDGSVSDMDREGWRRRECIGVD